MSVRTQGVDYHHHQETDVNKGLNVSNRTMTPVVGPNNETNVYAEPVVGPNNGISARITRSKSASLQISGKEVIIYLMW